MAAAEETRKAMGVGFDEIGEGIARCEPIDAKGLELFGRMGVDAATLHRTWRGHHEGMWTARVQFSKPGFEFAEQGRKAWIMLALDPLGDPLDLVAWRPKEGLLASWRNLATLLGEENLGAARMRKLGGLPVWRSPLGWLRAKRYGIVIVMPRYAARRLLDHEPFEAEDAKHARELRQLLTLRAPKIVVEEPDERVPATPIEPLAAESVDPL